MTQEDQQQSDYVTVYVTAESEDVAVHMATAAVKSRLIACANVCPGSRSIYEYDGIIQLEKEVILFMKTSRQRVPELIAMIKEMHSYQVPCITVLPIEDGNPDYLDWVNTQTKS